MHEPTTVLSEPKAVPLRILDRVPNASQAGAEPLRGESRPSLLDTRLVRAELSRLRAAHGAARGRHMASRP